MSSSVECELSIYSSVRETCMVTYQLGVVGRTYILALGNPDSLGKAK